MLFVWCPPLALSNMDFPFVRRIFGGGAAKRAAPGDGGPPRGAPGGGGGDDDEDSPSTAMVRQISLPSDWEHAPAAAADGINAGDFQHGFRKLRNASELCLEFERLAESPVGPRDKFCDDAAAARAALPTSAWTPAVQAAFAKADAAFQRARRPPRAASSAHLYGTALLSSADAQRAGQYRDGRGLSFAAGDLLRLEREDNDWWCVRKQGDVVTGTPFGAERGPQGRLHTTAVQVCVHMFRLPQDSEEATEVQKLFNGSSAGKRWSHFTVDRIQSPELWEDYYLLRERLFRRCGAEGLNEKLVWHGCAGKVVLPIAAGGFDWRLCGLHGTAYGRGAYFAVNSSYSQNNSYSTPDPGTGLKHMFLCRIVAGRQVTGNSRLQRPPPGFHSAVNNMKSPTIYVTFEIAQACPMYHVTFKT